MEQNQRELEKMVKKKFDYCGICLHPVIVPMCCGKGHLYCKECILEYLVKHKKEYEFKMEKYQELQMAKKETERELEREKVENEIKTFDKYLGGSSTEPQNNQKQEQEKKQVQDQTNNRIKELSKYTSSEAETKIMKSVEKSATKEKRPLNNFWIQDFSENPNEKPVEMEQPKKEAKCPLGDHTIKASKLIKLVFKNNESEKTKRRSFSLSKLRKYLIKWQKIWSNKKLRTCFFVLNALKMKNNVHYVLSNSEKRI